jgi:putative glycosyltransferase
MKLSIVSTLYLSEAQLEEFYRRAIAAAERITSDYELVLVDDGSPDHSVRVARPLVARDPHVRLVRLSRNYGHFHAIMTGLAHARGDLVFLIDSDLEEAPEMVEEFFARMQEADDGDPIDVVYGVQTQRKGRLFERSLGAFFYSVFNFVSEIRVPRNALVARLMTRRYVNALLQYRERELFMLGVMTVVGFRQEPVLVDKADSAPTTYKLWKKVSLTLKSMASFSDKPLSAIFLLGSGISFLALLGMLYLLINYYVFSWHYLTGWTSLSLLISFFGGMILASVGTVGFYLGRIFVEVKDRPVIVMQVEESPAGNSLNQPPPVVSSVASAEAASARVDDHAGIITRFLKALDQKIDLRGVIHVGAHQGQEVEAYLAHGCQHIELIEPNPEACRILRARFGSRPEVHIIEAAALDEPGVATLHLHTSRSGSTEPASVLPLKRFKEIVPTLKTPRGIEVNGDRLDSLLDRFGVNGFDFQLLNIDVQGAELRVLRGAERTLAQVDAVLVEVQVVDLYDGAASEEELDKFLTNRGFKRVDVIYHELYDERGTFPAWGEALYLRQSEAKQLSRPQ